MSSIAIRQATREGARLVIMVAGVSGSGKTRTALEIALGLAEGDPSRIGMIDAENRRGSLYADVYSDPKRGADRTDVPFLIGDLYAPFSPQRYIDAILAFQAAGVRVLIIDSGSHEWEGIGGCEDIAKAGNPNMPNWNKAKAEHKRFMNTLLACDMDIILCLRAREKSKPERVVDGNREKTVYVDLGLQAIAEKNVLFEATVSLMIHDEGTRQDVIKCPAPLRPYFARGEGYITAADGRAARAWVDGAKHLNPAVEKFRNRLLSITEKGTAYVENAWGQTPAEIRDELGEEFHRTLLESAKGYEELARQTEENARQAGSAQDAATVDLNAAIAAAAQAKPAPAPEGAPAAAEEPREAEGADLF